MSADDLDLLRDYTHHGSEAAFAAVVARHVDLVYSVALRQVRSRQLAEEVAQSVFVDLARQAPHLRPDTHLAGWLHTASRRAAIDVVRRESRRQKTEAFAAELAAMKDGSADWTAVEPLLDEAVESLPPPDRRAILLRFFESKSFREIGAVLGTSDDVAQKRVSRAVEQLRIFFVRRGIAATAASLVTGLSAYAVATAPSGLSAAISATLKQAAVLEAVKIVAMTTTQKLLVSTVVALALGGALFEARQIFSQRSELDTLRQRTAELAAQVRRAEQKQSAATQQLEVAGQRAGALRAATELAPTSDPAVESEMRAWLGRLARLKQLFAEMPEKTIPEMRLLSDREFMSAVQNADLEDMSGRSRGREDTLGGLRSQAKVRFMLSLSEALANFVKAHDGHLPADVDELLPFFKDNGYFKASAVEEAMLQRYRIVYSGALSDVPADERNATLVEITSSDEESDQRIYAGPNGAHIGSFRDLKDDARHALNGFAKANAGGKPGEASQLIPFFNPPLSPARQTKFLQNAASLLPH